MRCPRCGNTTDPGAAYCGSCGARLDTPASQQTTAPGAQSPGYGQATYARVVDTSSRGIQIGLTILALLLGISIGGYFVYRTVHRGGAEKQSAASVKPQIESPPSTPPPEPTDSNKTPELASPPEPVRSEQFPKRSSAGHHTAKAKRVQDAAPQLLEGSGQPSQTANPPQETATSQPSPPVQVTSPNNSRHRAVQETDAESAPSPARAAGPDSAQQPATAIGQTEPPPAPMPSAPNPPLQPAPPSRPAYNGPLSGIATWMGKLDKNDTLTITGGTPSTGVLSGTGLPGVPIRIMIDQSNLGFTEMPNASNGYRRLVLKSHSKHDKITIRWSVVQ